MDAELARGPWLAGGTYSLADIALLPYFVAMEAFELGHLHQRFTNIGRWYAAACARDCFNGHPLTMVSAARLREIRDILPLQDWRQLT